MKIKTCLLILGLFIFLAGVVSATDSYVMRAYMEADLYGTCNYHADDAEVYLKADFGIKPGDSSGTVYNTLGIKDSSGRDYYDMSMWDFAPHGSEVYLDSEPQYNLDCSEGCEKEMFNLATPLEAFYSFEGYFHECGYSPLGIVESEINAIVPKCECNKVTYDYDGEVYSDSLDSFNVKLSYTQVWSGKPIVPAGVVCKPCGKMQFELDTEYIAETKKDRLFTPYPTPFDNYVCGLVLDDETELNYVSGLGTNVRLLTSDGDEINSGKLTMMKEVEDKFLFYWEIRGWDGKNSFGIAKDSAGMEKLIQNQKLNCEITIEGYEPVKMDKPLDLSNCVRVWGSDGTVGADSGDPGGLEGEIIPVAEFNIEHMRGKSSLLSPSDLISLSKDNRNKGIEKISPFKEYKYKFAYFADIKEHDDSTWDVDAGKFASDVYSKIFSASSCNERHIFPSSDIFYNEKTYDAYATHDMPFVLLNIKELKKRGLSLSLVFVHEFGHSFVGLIDEYNFPSQIKEGWHWPSFKFLRYGPGEKNCVKDPTKEMHANGFYFDSKAYGDLIYNNNGKGCSVYNGFFVPSEKSMMACSLEDEKSARFNVISCYFLVRRLDKQLGPQERLDACMTPAWNTIKPGAVCIVNEDCTLDNSEGCALCDQVANKCFYSSAGESCELYDQSAHKVRYGLCGRRDTAESKAFCVVNSEWECSSDNIIGCLAGGKDDECVACSDERKCVNSNERGACTKYLNAVPSNGYCVSGKCESSMPL